MATKLSSTAPLARPVPILDVTCDLSVRVQAACNCRRAAKFWPRFTWWMKTSLLGSLVCLSTMSDVLLLRGTRGSSTSWATAERFSDGSGSQQTVHVHRGRRCTRPVTSVSAFNHAVLFTSVPAMTLFSSTLSNCTVLRRQGA